MSLKRPYATTLLICLCAAALSGCMLRDRRNTGQRLDQGTARELQAMETLTTSTGRAESPQPNTNQPLVEEPTLEQDSLPATSPTPDPLQVLDELMGELTELENLLGATQSWEVELP